MSDLRRMIVPVYLFHRYEVDSVAKSVGGVDFGYAVLGDGAPPPSPVDGAAQRRALAALLSTLEPEVLDLPDRLIADLSVGRDGTPDHAYDIEVFGQEPEPIFDVATAARAAIDITLDDLLEPSRLERVADQGGRIPGALGLPELLDRTVDEAFGVSSGPARLTPLRRLVRRSLVVKLSAIVEADRTPPAVRTAVNAALARLSDRLAKTSAGSTADAAFDREMGALIKTPGLAAAAVRHVSAPPPGMPIGAANGDDGWFDGGPGGE